MIYGKMMQTNRHDHNLELEYEVTPYTCNGCKEIGFHSRYKCDEPFSQCNFHLHKDCAIPEDTITHPFFPGCTFVFLESPESPDRHCDACARPIKGYNYHYFDKGLDLHPSCATLLNTMVEGELTLKLRKKLSSKCYKCREKKYKNKKKSWSYVSSCGECHLHVACVKDMLLENWEKECLRGVNDEDAKALVKREAPKLQIVIDKDRKTRSWGRLGKYKKIVQVALTFVMAAVVGDPTALVIGLLSSLITH